jgi:polyisoprenoid-binding protein YceI
MLMMKTNRLLSVLLLASLPAVASATLRARAPAQISFVALGPAGLRIEGKSSALQVTDRPDALVVTVPLAGLETGISLRDHHMHEKYLESQKYPNAQLAVARNAIKFPAAGQTTEGTVPATLALHGKSKTVPVHYKASHSGKAYDVKGDLKIDFREFGIEIPNYLGATVKPPVDVNVAFVLDES